MNTRDPDRDAAREIRGLQAQLAVLTLAFLLMAAFQTFQSVRDRIALLNVRAAQEPTIQQGLRLRQQVNGLATGIARLADGGDASAQAIIADMQRQGITVRAPGTATK